MASTSVVRFFRTCRFSRYYHSASGFKQFCYYSSETKALGGNVELADSDAMPDDQTIAAAKSPSLDTDLLDELLVLQQQRGSDMPIAGMASPYKKPRRRCFLCKYEIDLDYKNVQLLSQFTSPYTGRIYGRHITGLCIPMQKRIAQLIERSRFAGFMPFRLKETTFLADPKLFDPFKQGNKKVYF